MNMPLALLDLLLVKHEEIATDIKSQAFAVLGKNRPKEGWPADDERRIRHEALMDLHYALRKYRRMWDQPTQPLTRKLSWRAQSYVHASFSVVFDRLLECLPYLSREGPVGSVLKTRGTIARAWHFTYLADTLDRLVARDPLRKLQATDKAHARAVRGGIEFTLHRYFPQVNFSDVVGAYEMAVECGQIGYTISEELAIFQHILDEAGPVYVEVCRNPEMWAPRVPRFAHKWMAEGRRAGLPILNNVAEVRPLRSPNIVELATAA